MHPKNSYLSGLFYALLCYSSWGLFPLYWKLLKTVPADQILAHRIIWSLVFLVIILWFQHDSNVKVYLVDKKKLLLLAFTALLIGGNWFVYIFAVNSNKIVDASLGYYINPLVNVLLGTMILKERLNRLQIFASLLALLGVGYLTFQLGRLPVISLFLAITFGLYGLLRKKMNLQSMPGLMIETLILSPFALIFLFYCSSAGSGAFMNQYTWLDVLLLLGGPITALPLFWFGIATTRIPLSTLGFIQYLSPTLQLLLGVFVFRESFNNDYLFSFLLVWAALILFTISIFRSIKKQRAPFSV